MPRAKNFPSTRNRCVSISGVPFLEVLEATLPRHWPAVAISDFAIIPIPAWLSGLEFLMILPLSPGFASEEQMVDHVRTSKWAKGWQRVQFLKYSNYSAIISPNPEDE